MKKSASPLLWQEVQQVNVPPSMVLHCYKRLPKNIALKAPPTWRIWVAKNGWMTGKHFFEYVANICYERLINNGIVFPILLFVDGHKSHLSLNLQGTQDYLSSIISECDTYITANECGCVSSLKDGLEDYCK